MDLYKDMMNISVYEIELFPKLSADICCQVDKPSQAFSGGHQFLLNHHALYPASCFNLLEVFHSPNGSSHFLFSFPFPKASKHSFICLSASHMIHPSSILFTTFNLPGDFAQSRGKDSLLWLQVNHIHFLNTRDVSWCSAL